MRDGVPSQAPRLRPGAGVALAQNATGTTMVPLPQSKTRHPWQVTPRWHVEEQRWCATIEPGFVNGRCPSVRTSVKEQTMLQQRVWENNPLTGKPFFSDPIFASEQPGQASEEKTIDVPLYLRPMLPLSFHEAKSIPDYFAAKGAFNPQPATVTGDGEIVEAEPPPANYRLLRACDVWIHQPRLALTSDISLQPGPVTGISNVTQTLGLRSALQGDVLRMMAGSYQPTAGADPLAGVYEEAPWDELVIATVFALSPPNTEPGTEVDATWAIEVRQAEGIFWNLQYETPWFRQYGGDPSIPFLPPLAFGVAQLVINFTIASINDLTQQALNLVTQHSMAGVFYVPTGGGQSIKMPSTPAAIKGRNGVDRAGRRAAAIAASRKAKRELRLNPPFPYGAAPFQTSLLSQTV